MEYNEPKITWLVCAEPALMASTESGGGQGSGNGTIEMPDVNL